MDPVAYGQRFLNFLLSVMRGGDVGIRPPGLSGTEVTITAEEQPVGAVDGAVEEGDGPTRPAVVGHMKAE